MSIITDERNWAGNHRYSARALHRPASLDELRLTLSRARRIRVLGSRHSFNDLPDSDELVTLDGIGGEIRFDRDTSTVSVPAGVRYGELAEALDAEGVALHNLASLPHISVAGAVATATHGSGRRSANLATAVAALELVTSEGDVVAAARGDAEFEGMVVGLGALGAVTRVTLDVEPAYAVRQRVFEDLEWDALFADFDAVMEAGDSVSVFTRLQDRVDQVWVKSRVGDAPEVLRDDLFGARPATVDRHPIPGMDPVNATHQLGAPGPWWDRIPHFRMGFTPSNGEEIQSEFLLPRARAGEGLRALRELGDVVRPILQVCEVRAIAPDRLWMSPQYERETIGLHFTWAPQPQAVTEVLAKLEPALAALEARPHWGKVFLAEAETIAARYERLPEFVALAERLDPRGAFRNAWTERVLGMG